MPTDPVRSHDPDDPDPRELWRWVGAAVRPWLGWILIAVGAVLMLVGYFGVSREALPAKQIPYLVSGGIGGMFVAVLGAYFLATQELRRDSGRLDRLERMVEELHGALLQRADAPVATISTNGSDGPSRRVVAADGADLFHRVTCPIVAGKSVTGMTPAAARKQGLEPCPACTPAAVRAQPALPMFYVQIAILGVIYGGLYALSASGIVLTYTATGVFNIAHFAIALLSGYVGWQLNGRWGLPLVLVVPMVLLVCGPLLGLVLERVVFRPLQERRASSSERLVAALGVSVVVLALINVVWGPGVQGSPTEPVPRLFGQRPFSIGSLQFDTEQVGLVATVLVVAGLLYLLFQRTFLGTSIRAVVDRRELAELAAIDTHRISQVAWSLGCTLAAITGMIIPQGTLEPTRIIFFGIETFSVAVVARLTSIPRALLFGFLVMGLGHSLLDHFEPFGSTGAAADTYQAVVLNLSSIVLFVALVLFRKLDEVGDTGSGGPGLVVGALGRRMGTSGRVIAGVTALLALTAPAVLGAGDLRLAHTVLALTVIFVSIVCITGFSGHLTLGQASIAGLGAFFTARASNGLGLGIGDAHVTIELPVLPAMVVGAVIAMLAGLAVGYPALRRKGLFLGLTTLGLALVIDRFVFNTRLFQGPPGSLTVRRPELFGLDLTSDTAFYFYELAVVALALVLARNLRSGRLGRVLAAMRDSETAAQSVGIRLRRAKLFVFGVSSAMAGVGGALLTQADENWDTATFNPVLGLFWFTAVVVCGVSSIGGGVLAAIAYVAIPRLLDADVQSAIGIFGLGAIFLGRLPGGVVAQGQRLGRVLRAKLEEQHRVARRAAGRAAGPIEPVPQVGLELTDFAERVLS